MASDRRMDPRAIAHRLHADRLALIRHWQSPRFGPERGLSPYEEEIVRDMKEAADALARLYDDLHATALALREAERDVGLVNDWRPTTPRPVGQAGLPDVRRVVLLWIRGEFLPRLGYLKHAAGDKDCPYWVVYTAREDHHHGAENPGVACADVVAYRDCVPQDAPDGWEWVR